MMTPRPMTLSEIALGALHLLRQHATRLIRFAGIFAVGIWVALIVLYYSSLTGLTSTNMSAYIGSVLIGAVVAALIFSAASSLVGSIYIQTFEAGPEAADTTFQGTISRGMSAAPRLFIAVGLVALILIAVELLAGVASALASGSGSYSLIELAWMIASVWTLVSFAFIWQAAVIDGVSGPAALAKSWRLVQGSFWRTLGYVAVAGVIAFVIFLVADAIISGLDTAVLVHLGTVGTLITLLLEAAAFALIFAYWIAYSTLLFLDHHARKEPVSSTAGTSV